MHSSDTYYSAPWNDKFKSDLLIVSNDTFKFIKINETTHFCQKKKDEDSCFKKLK